VTDEAIIGGHESVLVIDDSSEQRELATAILNELGYEVYSVENGERPSGGLESAIDSARLSD
jgi:CheY-like chemotaxis protein